MMLFSAESVDDPRLRWGEDRPTVIQATERLAHATLRQVRVVKDDSGHLFPLKKDIYLNIYPSPHSNHWRAECGLIGLSVVGRGETGDEAAHDWTKRFRATVQNYISMRPFEMTSEDKEIWAKVTNIIDVGRYLSLKPITIKQAGILVKMRTKGAIVKWDDGEHEKVDPSVFDELFSHFLPGQPFEALVARNPLTFKLLRAEAVRRIPPQKPSTDTEKDDLWKAVVSKHIGHSGDDKPGLDGIDEDYWTNMAK